MLAASTERATALDADLAALEVLAQGATAPGAAEDGDLARCEAIVGTLDRVRRALIPRARELGVLGSAELVRRCTRSLLLLAFT